MSQHNIAIAHASRGRHQAPLLKYDYGAPGAIPTRDLPLRRRTLYAAELREHITIKVADKLFSCPGIKPCGYSS